MHTYRIVLDAYNSRSTDQGARVALFVKGHDQDDAFRRVRTVAIDSTGKVYPSCSRRDGWIGTNNMPPGAFRPRTLPEWSTVSIRAVRVSGASRVLWEYEKS